jgi:hypothetical protein
MSEVQNLDSKTMIPLVNKRSNKYTASLPNGNYYEWLPCMEGIEDSIEVPFKDVQYLHMTSSTFREGHLFVDHEEARKRLRLENDDHVKALTMSREDIEKILKGNMNALKKLEELKGDKNMIREVLDVAKEIGVDNINKLNFLSELSGVPVDVIQGTGNNE